MSIAVAKYERQVEGPGKFEGEEPATVYFYEQWGNGDGESYMPGDEDSDDEATLFQIDADEAEAFGLEIGDWFILWEDSSGFVYGDSHESREEAEESYDEWLGLE